MSDYYHLLCLNLYIIYYILYMVYYIVIISFHDTDYNYIVMCVMMFKVRTYGCLQPKCTDDCVYFSMLSGYVKRI